MLAVGGYGKFGVDDSRLEPPIGVVRFRTWDVVGKQLADASGDACAHRIVCSARPIPASAVTASSAI